MATGVPGPGGRLAVLNDTQWAGTYLAAGISAIRMDVNNFGPEDLYLRLLFEDFGDISNGPTGEPRTLRERNPRSGEQRLDDSLLFDGARGPGC